MAAELHAYGGAAMELFDPAGTFNDDYLWFYDPLLTEERNREEVAELVKIGGLAPGASILDAPCGHGRLSNLLAAEGFEVTGVDVTPLFLERAEADAARLGVIVDYRQGDLRDLPVSGPFDTAVCWFTSFGYFDDDDNRQVLQQFANVLKPGGTLLLETLNHDGFVRNFTGAPAATIAERGDDLLTDVVRFNPITGRTETERTIRRDGKVRRSQFSLRLPTVPEFDEWLQAAGFSERSYSDREGRPLRVDSCRLIVHATK